MIQPQRKRASGSRSPRTCGQGPCVERLEPRALFSAVQPCLPPSLLHPSVQASGAGDTPPQICHADALADPQPAPSGSASLSAASRTTLDLDTLYNTDGSPSDFHPLPASGAPASGQDVSAGLGSPQASQTVQPVTATSPAPQAPPIVGPGSKVRHHGFRHLDERKPVTPDSVSVDAVRPDSAHAPLVPTVLPPGPFSSVRVALSVPGVSERVGKIILTGVPTALQSLAANGRAIAAATVSSPQLLSTLAAQLAGGNSAGGVTTATPGSLVGGAPDAAVAPPAATSTPPPFSLRLALPGTLLPLASFSEFRRPEPGTPWEVETALGSLGVVIAGYWYLATAANRQQSRAGVGTADERRWTQIE